MKNLLSVQGRMRRKHYWLIWLIVFIVNVCCIWGEKSIEHTETTFSIIAMLSNVFLILQGIKRMHDTGHSGWYLLIPFYNLILTLTPGTPGKNRYGADPKGLETISSSGMIDVLDAPEVISQEQLADNHRQGLVYMIVFSAMGYCEGVFIQLLPLDLYLNDDGLFNRSNLRILFNIIEIGVIIYLLLKVKNGLAKTALTIFLIMNVFYSARLIFHFVLNDPFQF